LEDNQKASYGRIKIFTYLRRFLLCPGKRLAKRGLKEDEKIWE